MISFVKKTFVFLSFIFFFFSTVANGKEVLCYKLVKSSDSNIRVGAIQFISFIGDQCYESNAGGVSVKNGTMRKNGYQSTHSNIVYTGGCFCGSGAKFEFNSDRSSLTVTSNDNRIYHFRKTDAPKGISTCSIIRNNDSGTVYNGSDYSGYNAPGYNVTANPSNQGNSNTDPKVTPKTGNTTARRKCVHCNGTGQIIRNDDAPANFGIEKPRKQCPVCGEWYNPNVFNHYHMSCQHCGGTGYIK